MIKIKNLGVFREIIKRILPFTSKTRDTNICNNRLYNIVNHIHQGLHEVNKTGKNNFSNKTGTYLKTNNFLVVPLLYLIFWFYINQFHLIFRPSRFCIYCLFWYWLSIHLVIFEFTWHQFSILWALQVLNSPPQFDFWGKKLK